jgi:integrase
MVRLQILSGARPGEICSMRSCDVDTSGTVWLYRPSDHKTAWRGRERRIFLGPEAQKILREWLRPEPDAYLFQPREAVAERRAAARAARKTPVQPSQQDRRKPRPRKAPGERYNTTSYRRAIQYAIERANRDREKNGEPPVPSWHPHQIRHLAASRLQREFGWDIARAVLGHESPDTTRIYVERDERLAREAVLRDG